MTETNIFYTTGDIQFCTCQTVVVPVNCDGSMEDDIDSIFRRRYPFMFSRYQYFCKEELLAPGKLWIYSTPTKRKILCFPVGLHDKASYGCVEQGLAKFLESYQEKGITSAAFPLFNVPDTSAQDVLGLMSAYLSKCDIPIDIYTEHIPRSITLVPLLEKLCGNLTESEIYDIKKKLCFDVD